MGNFSNFFYFSLLNRCSFLNFFSFRTLLLLLNWIFLSSDLLLCYRLFSNILWLLGNHSVSEISR